MSNLGLGIAFSSFLGCLSNYSRWCPARESSWLAVKSGSYYSSKIILALRLSRCPLHRWRVHVAFVCYSHDKFAFRRDFTINFLSLIFILVKITFVITTFIIFFFCKIISFREQTSSQRCLILGSKFKSLNG